MIKARIIDSEFKDRIIELDHHQNYMELIRWGSELNVVPDSVGWRTFRGYNFSHIKDGISIYTRLEDE